LGAADYVIGLFGYAHLFLAQNLQLRPRPAGFFCGRRFGEFLLLGIFSPYGCNLSKLLFKLKR
jgi:hypothetical protein